MILMKNIITCVCGCGRVGPNHARNLIKKCYDRLNRKRAHVRFPRNRNELDPKPMSLVSSHIAERVADCARLHADGLHTMEIAIQLGVDQRTVWRYLRHLKAIKENTMDKKSNDHLADDLATSTDKQKNAEIVAQAIRDSKDDDAETDGRMGG